MTVGCSPALIRRYDSILDQEAVAERAIMQGLDIADEPDEPTLARPLREAE